MDVASFLHPCRCRQRRGSGKYLAFSLLVLQERRRHLSDPVLYLALCTRHSSFCARVYARTRNGQRRPRCCFCTCAHTHTDKCAHPHAQTHTRTPTHTQARRHRHKDKREGEGGGGRERESERERTRGIERCTHIHTWTHTYTLICRSISIAK